MSGNTVNEIASEVETDANKLIFLLQLIPDKILNQEITPQNYIEILQELLKIDEKLLEELINLCEKGLSGDPVKTRNQNNFLEKIRQEIKSQFYCRN